MIAFRLILGLAGLYAFLVVALRLFAGRSVVRSEVARWVPVPMDRCMTICLPGFGPLVLRGRGTAGTTDWARTLWHEWLGHAAQWRRLGIIGFLRTYRTPKGQRLLEAEAYAWSVAYDVRIRGRDAEVAIAWAADTLAHDYGRGDGDVEVCARAIRGFYEWLPE